jgi:hypothetical protein
MIRQKSLELIVPSVQYCRQIPEWAFKDVALRWRKTGGVWHVEPSYCAYADLESWPAPTLQEIWRDIDKVKNNVAEMCLENAYASFIVTYKQFDGIDEHTGEPINPVERLYRGGFCDSSVTTMFKAWCEFYKVVLQEDIK